MVEFIFEKRLCLQDACMLLILHARAFFFYSRLLALAKVEDSNIAYGVGLLHPNYVEAYIDKAMADSSIYLVIIDYLMGYK